MILQRNIYYFISVLIDCDVYFFVCTCKVFRIVVTPGLATHTFVISEHTPDTVSTIVRKFNRVWNVHTLGIDVRHKIEMVTKVAATFTSFPGVLKVSMAKKYENLFHNKSSHLFQVNLPILSLLQKSRKKLVRTWTSVQGSSIINEMNHRVT